MQIRLLLGPAGSGKTHRCLEAIRSELAGSPAGLPLLLLAPKQATYQLERQLLAWNDARRGESPDGLQGYTRLQIVSFEKLARFVFECLDRPVPRLIDEEGRLMVLRAILTRRRTSLKLFRASARLSGFARQLNQALHELQQSRLAPDALLGLAVRLAQHPGLSLKLQDLAGLLRDYLQWLEDHRLQDSDCLVSEAARALTSLQPPEGSLPGNAAPGLRVGGVWVDGFAEFSAQELDLLTALAGRCDALTLALCLDRRPGDPCAWLSSWSPIQRTFDQCLARFRETAGARIDIEVLPRDPGTSRFGRSPALAHLESSWSQSPATAPPGPGAAIAPGVEPDPDVATHPAIRMVVCPDPESEAVLAAREILQFVQGGGRYREASVMVRRLDTHHAVLERTFTRYGIPFFLDRRESVSHHPLAELTRSALRLAAFQWSHDDWFAALKTGLVPVEEVEVDRLENEALARGWKGLAWLDPIVISEDPERAGRFEAIRGRLVPPFSILVRQIVSNHEKLTGPELADLLRAFWRSLGIENQLDAWAADETTRIGSHRAATLHSTVWEQMNAWLDNVALAFASEPLSIRDWLPVLEAGLANLTVGAIPPALDQVLVGAIDRSRNPDIRLAVLLGLNEGLFPAAPDAPGLITNADREEMERQGVEVGSTVRRQLGRERYLAYIACTRPRERLVASCAAFDSNNRTLNRSAFFNRIRDLFPGVSVEILPRATDWRDSVHRSELLNPLLKLDTALHGKPEVGGELNPEGNPAEAEPGPARVDAGDPGDWLAPWKRIAGICGVEQAIGRLRQFGESAAGAALSPALAERLFGRTLRTSVSRLEQYAACPFRFFVHSALRAEERRLFELDVREQGNFQHDALAEFHAQLRSEGKRWRDITPLEARQRMAAITRKLGSGFREGLMQSSAQTRFTADVLSASLQDFVETLVTWMRRQYCFDPVAVEVPFGEGGLGPPWCLDLGNGFQLALQGRIDRVDVCREPGSDKALCVVVDYKSSRKTLDPLLVENGLQLQLLAYLNVLRHWPDPQSVFGVAGLEPAGVFYVNLRGRYEPAASRMEALTDIDATRKLAYRHMGRFDAAVLARLDSRPDVVVGDQFNYRRTKSGELHKGCREAVSPEAFRELLDSIERQLERIGREVYAGCIGIAPYRKGAATACEHCDYPSICRIDPWTHSFRELKRA